MDKIDIVEQNFAKLQMSIQNKMKNLRKKESIMMHWEFGEGGCAEEIYWAARLCHHLEGLISGILSQSRCKHWICFDQ
jgi:hypothetical protein